MIRWIRPLILVCACAAVACDQAIEPEAAPPCPPECVLTIAAPSTDVAQAFEVSATVTNIRGEPMAGVPVQWSLGLRLPCGGLCWPLPYSDIGAVIPGNGTTDTEGRVTGTTVLPAEGSYHLTARVDDDLFLDYGLSGNYVIHGDARVVWSPIAPMPAAGQGIAVARAGPRIYLMEGYCGNMGHTSPCAGRDTPGAEQYMDVFDIETGTWFLGPPAPVVPDWRSGAPLQGSEKLAVAAALDGLIHLVRGSHHHVYDPVTDLWTERVGPPVAGRQPRLEAVAGRLYLIGTGPDLRGVTAYDPVTAEWTPVASMPTGREGAASAVVGGLIYVAGGYGLPARSALERYDPAADAWETLPSMILPRYEFAGGAVEGLFCTFGGGLAGLRAGRGFQETYCYDPESEQWTLEPKIPWTDVILVAAAGDGSDVYAFGGGNFTYLWDMAQVTTAARLSLR